MYSLNFKTWAKTCEVTAFVDGVILRGVEKSDMYKSIDLVFDKVERQIHKYKTRLAKRFKESNVLNKQFVEWEESVPGESEFEIVRQKRFTINPNVSGRSYFTNEFIRAQFFYVF